MIAFKILIPATRANAKPSEPERGRPPLHRSVEQQYMPLPLTELATQLAVTPRFTSLKLDTPTKVFYREKKESSSY